MTGKEKELVDKFVKLYFGDIQEQEISKQEAQILEDSLTYVSSRFSGMKYILGTGLDFALLAQLLSNKDGDLKMFRLAFSKEDIFQRYELVTSRGERQANTLSLSFNKGKVIGIRKIEENVLKFFHSLSRTDYPNACVYNTGQWKKYQDLLENVFKLSETGRFKLVQALIELGLEKLTKNTFYTRSTKRVRLFDKIIVEYPRGVKGENGGLLYQAIAYSYYSNDFRHLNIVVDKVRTGSSRQKRFGDIDCYFGLDLEISVEVKDFQITNENLYSELGSLITNTKDNSVLGVAFVTEIADEAMDILETEGISVVTQADLEYIVSLWDWQKQNNSVHSILHYLAHIEQDPKAVNRLLKFIFETDPNHDALTFFS